MLRASPMGVLLLGDDHTIHEINEQALELLGYSREELIGEQPRLFHPGHDTFERALEASGARPCSAEAICIRKDGRSQSLKITGALVDPDAPGRGYALTLLERGPQDSIDEPYFARIFDQIPDAVCLTRVTDNTFAEINQAFEDQFDYSRGELIGRTSLELGLWEHPEDQDRLVAAIQDTPLVRGLEFRMRKKDGHSFIASFTAREIERDGNTLRLVILNDTTEHRNIENALRESEAHLEAAQSHAHMGSWTLDLGLNRGFWSKQMYRLFDLEPAPFPPAFQDYLELVHPDDRAAVREAFQQVVQSGITSTREYRTNPARCTPRVLENTVCADSDAQGKPLHLSGTIQDITERKHIENALRESEKRIKLLVDNSNDLFFIINEEGLFKEAMGPVKAILGYEPQELIGQNGLDHIHLQDLSQSEAVLREAVAHPGIAYRSEYRYRHKDGRWITLETVGVNWLPDPDIQGILLNGRDITQRKAAEASLRLSETRLETAQAHAGIGSWEFDPTTRQLCWSKQMFRMFGLESQVTPPASEITIERVHPDDRAAVMEAFQRTLEQHIPSTCEYRTNPEDGPERIYSTSMLATEDAEGRLQFISGTIQDITTLKQAELAAREQERQWSTLVGNLPGVMYRCANDPHWTAEFVSAKCRDLFGIPEEDFLVTRRAILEDIIPPEQRPFIREEVQRSIANREPYRLTYRVHTRKDREVWVSEQGQGICDKNGNLEGLEGFIFDISELKRVEKALRESETKYRSIFNNLLVGVFESTPDGRFLSINPAMAQMFGYTTPEEMRTEITDIATQVYAVQENRDHVMQSLRTHGRIDHLENPVRHRDGHLFWTQLSVHQMRDEVSGQTYYEGSCIDITERKRADEALRQSEANYRGIFENALEGIFRTTPQGRYLTVNPTMARMHGYDSPDEMVHMVTDMAHQVYVDPQDRTEILRSLAQTGRVDTYEYQARHRDGHLF